MSDFNINNTRMGSNFDNFARPSNIGEEAPCANSCHESEHCDTNLNFDPNAIINRGIIAPKTSNPSDIPGCVQPDVVTGIQFLEDTLKFLKDNPDRAKKFNDAFETALSTGLPYDASLVIAEGALDTYSEE